MLYLIPQFFGPMQLVLEGVEFLAEILPVILGFLPVMLQDVQQDLLRAWHWDLSGCLGGERVPSLHHKHQGSTRPGQ